MRPLSTLLLSIALAVSVFAQCEGDLLWEFDEGPEQGPSLGRMFSEAFTPKLVTDTKEIRGYIRDGRFRTLMGRCGDLRAVDAIYQKALRVAEYNVGRALLLSMMAVLEHQQLQIKIPIFQSLTLPLTLEDDSLFAQRVRNLPGIIYPDSPKEGDADRDKLQHFFASAYLAYASESPDIARGAGNAVEWGEAQFVVGGANDLRDKRANKQGETFGKDLLIVKDLLPSDYFTLPIRTGE